MLNELGRTLFEYARQQRGDRRRDTRLKLLERARKRFEQVLALDPENVTAHYNIALVYAELDQPEQASQHRKLHEKYRPDDHAIERAVSVHRSRNPAANHAAEAVAIYDLQRPESLQWNAGSTFAETTQPDKGHSLTGTMKALATTQIEPAAP
jgi:tetratricopeptide (TPR) repeat protein